jgi:KipI family sensor histidine kinase inhibitor
VTPFGDRAVRFLVEASAPRRKLLANLSALPGVVDVVLTEEIGCVVFDDAADRTTTERAVERTLASLPTSDIADATTAHVIRVVYDGEDLDAVARAIDRSREAVIRLHSEREYRVAMLGFLPGFGYLRGLDDALRLPRRAPRPRVPARSVAIAAQYTGIYPYASPGGWHLLGRAIGFEPFRAGGPNGEPERALLALGDTVRFSPAHADEGGPPVPDLAREPTLQSVPSAPHLEVVRAAGIALLVDGGRRGRMHDGVPHGGPLVRSMFGRANALAGNAPSACAVEVSGTLEVVARGGSVVIAEDTERVELADGERHVVSTRGRTRVAYLAIAGGIEAPVVLGGRGALLAAGIGGLLKRGERLAPSRSSSRSGSSSAPPSLTFDDAPIAIVAGPDSAAGSALEAMTRHELRVSTASDRTGTRLEGWSPEAVDASRRASESTPSRETTRSSTPMVIGAIELTPSGLIVLGPDHPTTGGYPVVALVRASSLDALFRRPIGASIRFALEV